MSERLVETFLSVHTWQFLSN